MEAAPASVAKRPRDDTDASPPKPPAPPRTADGAPVAVTVVPAAAPLPPQKPRVLSLVPRKVPVAPPAAATLPGPAPAAPSRMPTAAGVAALVNAVAAGTTGTAVAAPAAVARPPPIAAPVVARPAASSAGTPGTPAAGAGSSFAERIAPRIAEAIVTPVTPEAKAVALEVATAIVALGSEAGAQARMVVANLKNPGNGQLRADILAGVVAPAAVAAMTSRDLMTPADRKKADEDTAFRNKGRDQTAMLQATAFVTNLFRCPKCGRRRCAMTQKQTRSGDEPMTTFLTCMECGLNFKRY